MHRLWSRSSRLYLAASLILALSSGLMLRGYIGRVASAERAAGPRVAVVLAAERIPRGEIVELGQLAISRLPKAFVPPGSFSSIDQVAGRVSLTDISPREPVTQTRLAGARAGPVASLVPPGLRAFAVPSSLPAGAVAVGD